MATGCPTDLEEAVDKKSEGLSVATAAASSNEDDDLEVIYVKSSPTAQRQQSSSSSDVLAVACFNSISITKNGKFAACASSMYASNNAKRILSMTCCAHNHADCRHAPVTGGKLALLEMTSKSKRKRTNDGDQIPPLLGKKQCNPTCTMFERFDDDGYDEFSEDSQTCADIPSSPVSSSTEPKTAPPASIITTSPEIADWVSSFMKWSNANRQQALASLIPNCNLSNIRYMHKTIEPYFRRDFISLLPRELSLHVLSYLNPAELLTAAQVCRYWRTLTEDVILWREKCLEEGICPDSLPAPPNGTPASSSCFSRCPWKSVYLRHNRVEMNWRRRTPLREVPLRGHEEHVITCLQICGDKIVSGSDDNTLIVWSTQTGEKLVTMVGHNGGVWSSQISEEGDLVISGSTDRTVKVWDIQTGNCLLTLAGHTSTVRCMALRGDVLVSGSRDDTLRVWDIRTGECLHVLTGHTAAVRCVQFDGRRAVSGAYDCAVKIWDVETETCLHTLQGHTNRVYSLQFYSDRNIIISGSLDASIRVWDVVAGKCLHTLIGHQSLTSGMQLRGNILVSGNADSTIKVWDISNGRLLYTLAGEHRHQSAVTSIQFLQNGLVVSSSDDGSVKIWDALTGEFIRDIVRLTSFGGCIWRLRATPTMLLCAIGSRGGTEDTKLLLLDFNADYP